MAFTRRVRSTLILVLILLGTSALYYFWSRGYVVASLTHGGGHHPYTFCIRQIPLNPPGMNGGYAYRCEIWWRNTLIKASTHRWDSFTARVTSIEVGSHDAVFHIDDHDISCTPFEVWSDSQWSGGFP